jgi:hypothetical protein
LSLRQLGITKFVPELFQTTESTIVIENLLNGTNPNTVRFMDIKLGTSAVTLSCKAKNLVESREAKDQKTTGP